MTCRGFQYEEGKDYETDKAELCESGFHACERPLDVFKFYEPATSVYHEVELDGDTESDDKKTVATKIHIGGRLNIPALVNAQIEYTKSRCTTEHTDTKLAAAGDRGAATAGDSGAATAGNFGAATAGDRGAATAGDRGAATAGDSGAATAGDSGAATAGNFGAATAGDRGAATAGDRGAATAGDSGAATAGDFGSATAGDRGAATSRGSSSVGANGIACARGNGCRVKGGLGAVLVIAEEKENTYDLERWRAVVVDGEKIKADTWYTLKGRRLVEVE